MLTEKVPFLYGVLLSLLPSEDEVWKGSTQGRQERNGKEYSKGDYEGCEYTPG